MKNRSREIVDELNATQERYEAAMDAAYAVEYREEDPELPNPTPEELAELEAKAAAAKAEIAAQDYEGKLYDLKEEYAALNNGEWPHYNGATDTYMY